MISSLKVSSINQLALLCGLPTPTLGTKANRIQYLIAGLQILPCTHPNTTDTCFVSNTRNQLQTSKTICGIDIGLTHFSYCVTKDVSICSLEKIKIYEWDLINLHDRFGINYIPIHSISKDALSALDSRRYLNHLAASLAKQILQSRPDHIVLETQRTRSTNNSNTLPAVMKNLTFENLLIANLMAIRPDVLIWPMAVSKMVSFWVNRFVTRKSLKLLPKNLKTARHHWFTHWLSESKIFDASDLFVFPISSQVAHKNSLVPYLLGISGKKLDDLIDSLLYTMTLTFHLRNIYKLKQILAKPCYTQQDILEFIDDRNRIQIDLIRPIVARYHLEPSKDFVAFF